MQTLSADLGAREREQVCLIAEKCLDVREGEHEWKGKVERIVAEETYREMPLMEYAGRMKQGSHAKRMLKLQR